MTDVDGLLERLRLNATANARTMELAKHRVDSGGLPDCWVDIVAQLFTLRDDLPQIIATIEQQRTEIERLRSQLSPRCSIPADMELDDAIVRFTNRTDEPC